MQYRHSVDFLLLINKAVISLNENQPILTRPSERGKESITSH